MNIHCRICGEPFDQTEGLHFSKSDMTAWHHRQFLEGKGCPCCCGDVDPRAEHTMNQAYKDRLTEKWARSIQSASDEDPPYPGFYEAVETPWTVGEWTDEPPIIWDRVSPEERQLLVDLGGPAFRDLEREEQPNGDFSIRYKLPHEYFSPRRDEAVRFVNHRAAMCRLRAPLANVEVGNYSTSVEVAVEHADGSYELWTKVISELEDMLSELRDYPCLDDEALSELELEQANEAWAQEVADNVGWASEFTGCSEAAVEALFDKHRDDISRDVDGLPTLDATKAKQMLASYAGAPGWEFYQSNIARTGTWFAVMNPTREPLPLEISGLVLRPNESAEFVESVRSSEFGSDHAPTPRVLGEIPVGHRVAFLDALSD